MNTLRSLNIQRIHIHIKWNDTENQSATRKLQKAGASKHEVSEFTLVVSANRRNTDGGLDFDKS